MNLSAGLYVKLITDAIRLRYFVARLITEIQLVLYKAYKALSKNARSTKRSLLIPWKSAVIFTNNKLKLNGA
jgi:hypothetical protein